MSCQISFVHSNRWSIALRLLFARFPVEEQQTRLADALKSAERGTLNLDGLLLAEENGQPVGAALMMRQADGITLVWPPVMTCRALDGPQVADALMARICQETESAGSGLAQVLLSPDDSEEFALLARHGFQHVADMFFMARPLTSDDAMQASDIGQLEHQIFNSQDSDRFASVIQRTYDQSLDCPLLNGFRTGKDALASHRLSGTYDPAGWRLYHIGSQEIGVLLMNEHPDQDAVELVYFGIIPEFRGQGLGRRILAHGIQAAAIAGRAVMFLAVDCGNRYANALYGEFGFVELARRRIMIRCSSQMACK